MVALALQFQSAARGSPIHVFAPLPFYELLNIVGQQCVQKICTFAIKSALAVYPVFFSKARAGQKFVYVFHSLLFCTMKKSLFLLVLAMIVAACTQQVPYASLWEEANQAIAQDLPRTALECLEKIEQKAEAEGNETQLLKMWMARCNCLEQISVEEAMQAVGEMDSLLAKKQASELKALWHTALAELYEQMSGYSNSLFVDNYQKAKAHWQAAFEDAEKLAEVPATRYGELLTVDNTEKKYGSNDVLMFVYLEYVRKSHMHISDRLAMADKVAAVYEKQGNRPAQLSALLEKTSCLQFTEKLTWLETLAKDYEDLPLNVETYILWEKALGDLRNTKEEYYDSLAYVVAQKGWSLYKKEKRAAELEKAVRNIEEERVTYANVPNMLYPGKEYVVPIEARNCEQVVLRVMHLGANAHTCAMQQSDCWQEAEGQLLKTLTCNFPKSAPYKIQKGQVKLTIDEPGVYRLQLMTASIGTHSAQFFVTRMALQEPIKDGENVYLALVDAQDGSPLKDCKVIECDGNDKPLCTYEPKDGNGFLIKSTNSYGRHFFAQMPGDEAMPGFSLYVNHAGEKAEEEKTELQLFTDRAIYRPGQKVQVGGVLFKQKGDHLQTIQGKQVEMELCDVNGKVVDSLTTTSDPLGNVSGEFLLPKYCLLGNFSIRAEYEGGDAYIDFLVEEYKRPTIKAELILPNTAYALGDTVVVKGKAETLTGMALEGAEVHWSVQKHTWGLRSDEFFKTEEGRLTADAQGCFEVPVVLAYKPTDATDRFVRYTFEVTCKVTAPNGETTFTSQWVCASTQPTYFETTWPGSILKEDLPQITVCRNNAAGDNQAGKVVCRVYCGKQEMAESIVETGKNFQPNFLKKLPSGKYKLRLCQPNAKEGEDLEQDFLLFSEKDKRPAQQTEFWQHVKRNKAGDEALVLIGSSQKNVHLHYYLTTAKGIQESRHVLFSDSILRFSLKHKEAYGSSALACFVFRKNGVEHKVAVNLQRPIPNKDLKLEWTSFRSVLAPGQQEEWRISVKHPDGRPAKTSLMARLYDASLDAFVDNPWGDYAVHFSRPNIQNPSHSSHCSDVELQDVDVHGPLMCPERATINWSNVGFRSARNGRHDRVMLATYMSRKNNVERAQTFSGGEDEEVELRTNFAETAFFYPALRTNDKGEVSIGFQLPESLTKWHFNALAHTADMKHGKLQADVVARKPWMVQGALPRFVREGDKALLPVTVRNLTDQKKQGEVVCELREADTDKVVLSEIKKIAVAAQGSETLTFAYEVKSAAPLLVCHVSAKTEGHSDGEEILLPVVSGATSVTRTLPFSVKGKGNQVVALAPLLDMKEATHRQLTLEISSNPIWNVVATLPVLAESPCHSSQEWATRYYALVLGDYIAKSHPQMKTVVQQMPEENMGGLLENNFYNLAAETPWLREAENEQARTKALKSLFDNHTAAVRSESALNELQQLQNQDGSWSWYKGMSGNVYTTCDIAILLARLQQITGDKKAKRCLDAALQYLSKEVSKDKLVVAKDVAPSEWHLRYLYLRHLMGLQPDNVASGLLEKASKMSHQLTMYGKAIASVFLPDGGYNQAAQLNVKSLLEYTVVSPEMGRYFDTHRAQQTSSYRIPTQVATIEALRQSEAASEVADVEAVVEEMQLWLLQAKRTQLWETSRATTDAVYALLMAGNKDKAVAVLTNQTPLSYTLGTDKKVVVSNVGNSVKQSVQPGYVREVLAEEAIRPLLEAPQRAQLKLQSKQELLAWGSVKNTFVQPETEVVATSAGLSLKRYFEVWRNGSWVRVQKGASVKVGEKVRQVFDMAADRDFDFVELKSARPACFEPTRALSGFAWQDGMACYRVVRDASTAYYFEKMRKGHWRFTEEYVADRAGLYQCSLSRLVSVYAPEYASTTSAERIEVLP